MLSLFLNGTRTPLETIDKIGHRTSALGYSGLPRAAAV
jgi:hypothetical protein